MARFSREYEHECFATGPINGRELLGRSVDDSPAVRGNLDLLAEPDGQPWRKERKSVPLH